MTGAEFILALANVVISWPSAALVIGLAYRKTFRAMFAPDRRLTAETKWGKVIWEVVERAGVPGTDRDALLGLDSYDIWALDTLMKPTEHFRRPALLNPPLRVAAKRLMGFGLVHVTAREGGPWLEVTPLGQQIMAAAKSLPLDVNPPADTVQVTDVARVELTPPRGT